MSLNPSSTPYQTMLRELEQQPRSWLVTGVGGFIGSHLLETLLKLKQKVTGLDNYSTGRVRNLDEVREVVGPESWRFFKLIEGDIRDLEICRTACLGVDHVLHQAALGSVSRSITEPLESHASNVTGFLNILVAARDAGVRQMVYASSSSVYGDHPDLPKQEQNIGACLSPYALTKLADELYAQVFARCYGTRTIGLRYFNVFGPRQDPDGPYAAVIPKWVAAMLNGQPVHINGDGQTSRDFCYVANVVQANLLAATTRNQEAVNEVYNVALHSRTTLLQLFELLKARLAKHRPSVKTCQPVFQDFREGDVRHSEADISKAQRLLGYQPTHRIEQGLDDALDWYRRNAVTAAPSIQK